MLAPSDRILSSHLPSRLPLQRRAPSVQQLWTFFKHFGPSARTAYGIGLSLNSYLENIGSWVNSLGKGDIWAALTRTDLLDMDEGSHKLFVVLPRHLSQHCGHVVRPATRTIMWLLFRRYLSFKLYDPLLLYVRFLHNPATRADAGIILELRMHDLLP